ncbi:MAG TPA: hypothetical protein VFP84_40645 [Kofleriaceae bacterium]|nr:hypothetical protein [Kofleriaceae bacterium]
MNGSPSLATGVATEVAVAGATEVATEVATDEASGTTVSGAVGASDEVTAMAAPFSGKLAAIAMRNKSSDSQVTIA